MRGPRPGARLQAGGQAGAPAGRVVLIVDYFQPELQGAERRRELAARLGENKAAGEGERDSAEKRRLTEEL